MKNQLLASLLACSLGGAAAAQAQDIGLTMHGGFLTVIYGQECGPVSCTPMFGSVIAAGEDRTLTHFSATQKLFAVAVGFPGPCLAVPGFDNGLLLSNPVILDWGLMPSPPFVALPCQQAIYTVTMTVPAGAPVGTVLRVQSIGESPSTGGFAFGPAIEFTTG